jgi:hypothetical protein
MGFGCTIGNVSHVGKFHQKALILSSCCSERGKPHMVGKCRKALLVVSALVLVLSLFGCTGSINEITIESTPNDRMVVSASPLGYTSCIGEKGLLYFNSPVMRYLDIATNKSYVLCSRPNCPHTNKNCLAWYGSINDAYGLAQFGEYIYVMKHNYDNNTFEMIQMDLAASTQRVISSLDLGEFIPGTWILHGLPESVYYAGDHAWFEATYQYCEAFDPNVFYEPKQDNTIIGINLLSGKVAILYEVSVENDWERSIELATRDYLVIKEMRDREPLLSEDEFQLALSSGEFPDFHDKTNPYFGYIVWHEQSKTVMYSYLIYDIKAGATTVFASGELGNYYDDNGLVYWRDSGYRFLDTFDNRIIYSINEYDMPAYRMNNWQLFYYDPAIDTSEFFLEVNGGNVRVFETGIITKEGDILYCLFTANETLLMYRYSLITEETTELFEDIWNHTFRLHGESSDYFIGSMMKDQDMSILYIISKDDYYAGNFNAAVRLRK